MLSMGVHFLALLVMCSGMAWQIACPPACHLACPMACLLTCPLACPLGGVLIVVMITVFWIIQQKQRSSS